MSDSLTQERLSEPGPSGPALFRFEADAFSPLYPLAKSAQVLRSLALHLPGTRTAEGSTVCRRHNFIKERRAKARYQKENRE